MKLQNTIICGGVPVVVEIMPDGNLVFHDHNIEDDLIGEEMGFGTSLCLELFRSWEYGDVIAAFVKHFDLPSNVWIAIFSEWARGLSWTYRDVLRNIIGSGIETALSTAPFDALRMVGSVIFGNHHVTKQEADYLSRSVEYDADAIDDIYMVGVFDKEDIDISSQTIVAAESFCRAVAEIVSHIAKPDQYQKEVIRRRIANKILEGEHSLSYGQVNRSIPKGSSQSKIEAVEELQVEKRFELLEIAVDVAGGLDHEL